SHQAEPGTGGRVEQRTSPVLADWDVRSSDRGTRDGLRNREEDALGPSGKLYLKVQQLLVHDETHDASPPPIVGKPRPGPKHLKYGIPTEHWPLIIYRVLEQKERLRTVAAAYGVSHETI